MEKDLTEVSRLINLYIDGAGKGNAEQLNEAFHPSAHWFGTVGGVDYALDKKSFGELMVSTPGDAGGLVCKIVDIQIDGIAATATVKETGFWGTLDFTDFFQLAILDGRWQITSKTFANTNA